MSKEYIEREAVIVTIKDLPFQQDIEDLGIYEEIKEVPSADVESVRHGRWIDMGVFDAHYQPVYQCSECNKQVADNYISCHKYCLHCGARMDGGNK